MSGLSVRANDANAAGVTLRISFDRFSSSLPNHLNPHLPCSSDSLNYYKVVSISFQLPWIISVTET